MFALGQDRPFAAGRPNVRFTPKADICALSRRSACQGKIPATGQGKGSCQINLITMRLAIFRMNLTIPMALAIICLGSSPAFPQQSASPAPAYMGTVRTCEGCHGSGGDSSGPSTPRLNGQKAEYIIDRLQDFLDSTKEAPRASYMVHAVKNIPDTGKAEIAQYFANQVPTEANTASQESSGQHIFEIGYPAVNIPACQSCHGSRGEGRGAVPRLAGQHAVYLRNQLWTFSLRLRQNNVMHANVMRMSSGQIDALVTYLANN